MRLTAFLLTVFCLQVAATSTAQISYEARNKPLVEVLKDVEKITGFHFVYADDVLNGAKAVTVSMKNASIERFMQECLQGQSLSFFIRGKTVIIERLNEKKLFKKAGLSNDPIEVLVRVSNEQGEPVAGVTIVVKGTKKMVATDAEGIATIKNVDPQSILVFTAVNILTTEAEVEGKRELLIKVKGKTGKLDEVQIIAYGKTSQRISTGSVTSVKASDISRQPISNPILALQGRVAGLYITQSSGFTNSGLQIRIQGKNSITRGNDPFFVIDGVPYVGQLGASLSGILQGGPGYGFGPENGSPFNFINPQDIESIDVLKDADATAIYGSRAANGAILITTKKGKAGQNKVDIMIQSGWAKVSRKLDLLNTAQYLEMRKEAFINDGRPVPNASSTPDFSNYDLTLWSQERFTDWQKELIGGTAKYQDLQSSFTGGNSNVQYLIGGSYHKETTVFPGDFKDSKGALHFSINGQSVNQKFKIQLSGNYMFDNNRLLNDDLTATAMTLAPNAPALYNQNGTLNWEQDKNGVSTWKNPLSYMNNGYNNKTNNLISNVLLSYDILKDLSFSTSLGYTSLRSDEIVLGPITAVAPENRPFDLRWAKYGSNNNNSWIIEPKVSFKRASQFGRYDVIIGSTVQRNNANSEQLECYGYSSDLVLEDIKAAPYIYVTSTNSSIYKYGAVYGRFNYNLQDKYIANITARRDGSSRFGSANQFHNFGALGLAWLFSNENIFKKKIGFVSFGKFRASYGSTGSDQIGNYQFMNQYTFQSLPVNYQNATGLKINGLNNPHLQWEETRKLQFGLDLGFLKDRILLNTNFYINRSSNQLLPYNLPIVTGFNSMTQNFPATVKNYGFELSLNSINIKSRELTWATSLNLTIPKNKLIKFENLEKSTYARALIIGHPITIIRVYHLLGVSETSGVYEFESATGSPTSTPNALTDRPGFVNNAPKYYGGIQNNIQYKGFELDFLFQFVKQIGIDYSFGSFPGTPRTNQPVYILDRWRKTGDKARIQKYDSDYSLNTPFSAAAFTSDMSYADASYIRLKNVSLSYNVSSGIKKKLHLQNCKIFAVGQNILTITDYKGLDPETKSSTVLPPLRVITVGLQLTL